MNTHQFTGSLLISGGTHFINGGTTVSGSLDVLGDFLINGATINTGSIVEDQEIYVGPIMINLVAGLYATIDDDGEKGNPPSQFAISSSNNINTTLNGGDKIKIKWIHLGVSYEHTTHIFTIKQSAGEDFNYLTNYNTINPNATPPFTHNWTGFKYNANASMSINTSIIFDHWKVIVGGYLGNSVPLPTYKDQFKLYKVIEGIPCCDPFGDSFYSGSIKVKGDAEFNHVKINGGGGNRLDDVPMLQITKGDLIPFQVTNDGVLKLHDYETPDTGPDSPPDAVVGGILFRNNEMYIGKG